MEDNRDILKFKTSITIYKTINTVHVYTVHIILSMCINLPL